MHNSHNITYFLYSLSNILNHNNVISKNINISEIEKWKLLKLQDKSFCKINFYFER